MGSGQVKCNDIRQGMIGFAGHEIDQPASGFITAAGEQQVVDGQQYDRPPGAAKSISKLPASTSIRILQGI